MWPGGPKPLSWDGGRGTLLNVNWTLQPYLGKLETLGALLFTRLLWIERLNRIVVLR